MKFECGFNGRTNKLVDNCYSFWQASVFRLIADVTGGKATFEDKL